MKPYPDIKICEDEDCTEEHNPIDSDEEHHYGCECSLCIEFYRSLK